MKVSAAVSPAIQMKLQNRKEIGQAWLKNLIATAVENGDAIFIDPKNEEEFEKAVENIHSKNWQVVEFYSDPSQVPSDIPTQEVTKR